MEILSQMWSLLGLLTVLQNILPTQLLLLLHSFCESLQDFFSPYSYFEIPEFNGYCGVDLKDFYHHVGLYLNSVIQLSATASSSCPHLTSPAPSPPTASPSPSPPTTPSMTPSAATVSPRPTSSRPSRTPSKRSEASYSSSPSATTSPSSPPTSTTSSHALRSLSISKSISSSSKDLKGLLFNSIE